MTVIRACPECGKYAPVKSKGLCNTCYHRAWREAKKPKPEPPKVRDRDSRTRKEISQSLIKMADDIARKEEAAMSSGRIIAVRPAEAATMLGADPRIISAAIADGHLVPYLVNEPNRANIIAVDLSEAKSYLERTGQRRYNAISTDEMHGRTPTAPVPDSTTAEWWLARWHEEERRFSDMTKARRSGGEILTHQRKLAKRFAQVGRQLQEENEAHRAPSIASVCRVYGKQYPAKAEER